MVLKCPQFVAGSGAAPALLSAAGLVVLLSACGSTSWNEVCNARCDSMLRCQYQTATESTKCHADCNNTKVTASDLDVQLGKECKNAGEIRSQQLHCYDSACRSGEDDFGRATDECLDSAQTTMCKKP